MDNDFTNSQDTIDIKKIIFRLLSNWYWFVITIFLALIIAYYVNRYADPVFQLKSTILIKDNSSSISNSIDQIISELSSFKRRKKKEIQNEIGKLSSYSLAYKTLKKLPFRISYYSIGKIRSPERYEDCPFFVTLNNDTNQLFEHPIFIKIISKQEYELSINQGLNIHKTLKFGENYKTEFCDFSISLKFPYDKDNEIFHYPYFFLIHDLNTLTNKYKHLLSIEQFDEKSTILNLSISEKIPKKVVII